MASAVPFVFVGLSFPPLFSNGFLTVFEINYQYLLCFFCVFLFYICMDSSCYSLSELPPLPSVLWTELWLNRGECFFAGSSTRLNRNRLCSLENSFVTTEPEASVLPGRGQEMRIHFIWNWTLGFAPVSYPWVAGIHNLGFLMWPITSGISCAVFYLLVLGRVHKH